MNAESYALIRRIRERPDDDAPRLVYADWLEENGEGERAEFIRLMVKGEPLTFGLIISQFRGSFREWFLPWYDGAIVPWHNEHRREIGFSGEWGSESITVVNRGLVSQVRLTLAQFLEHAPRIACEHPVQEWVITDKEPLTTEYASHWYGWEVLYSPGDIPVAIHSLLEFGHKNYFGIGICYPTKELAVKEFRIACQKWANSEADKLMDSTSTVQNVCLVS